MFTTSSRRWWALAALALAMLTIGLDTTVLTVALPTLADSLGASVSQLQWFSTSYTLVLAAVLLPAGSLGDRFGRKKLLVGALVVFGLASAACAYASSPGQLIAARAVLGLGAAFMMPLSMAVLPSLFPDAKDRGRAISIWVTATALGLPLGPILGGWLLDNFWWGSVFLINLPLVLGAIVAVALLVPHTGGEHSAALDVPGVLISAVSLLAVTYGCILAGERGWGDGRVLLCLAGGVLGLGLFLLRQRQARHPLIELRLFADRDFRTGTLLAVIATFGFFGLLFTLPQYFAAVHGTDALGTGLRLLPLIGGLVLGTRVSDRLSARLGRRVALSIGFVILAVSLAGGAFTGPETAFGLNAIWITGTGIGMGFTLPAAMAMATDALTSERAGSGSALLQALRQVAGTIGVAVLGTVLASVYRAGLSLDGVSAEAAEAIRSGVSGGMAQALGSDSLTAEVKDAFVSGMDVVLVICAALALLGVLVALTYRPMVRSDGTGPAPVRTNEGTAQEGDVVVGRSRGTAQSGHEPAR
ncbi:DHA2 family efflux MFS transporter permease subunit [Nakamurella silvestris]|nr:DHA2 family efflux MFS transporter permease subunit [Nakamurella silvestris]